MKLRIIHTERNGNREVRVYSKNDFDEYTVRLFVNGKEHKGAEYFDEDRESAIGTAREMASAPEKSINRLYAFNVAGAEAN